MARSPLYWMADEGSIAVNGTLYTTRVSSIEVRGGMRDVEQIRLFGGNSLLAERPQEIFETSITGIVSGVDFSKLVFGAGSTTTGGALVSGDGLRSVANVVYTWSDPTVTTGPSLRLRFASGFGVESTMTLGVDNQLEETFTFKCLARNTFREFSSGAASTLVTAPL